jgi:cytosine/adenosine deaminase-related metal-dependent hydrolase
MTIVRGRYLIDSTGRTVKDAEIAVEEGRIASIRSLRGRSSDTAPSDPARPDVSPGSEASEVIDLGNVAILPGFVNAHTHLDLTAAHTLVEPKPRFTDWIRGVIGATGAWGRDDFDASIREGISRSVEAGTTSLGDISNISNISNIAGQECGVDAYYESGMRVRLFHEVIGFDPAFAESAMESLIDRIGRMPPTNNLTNNVLAGISPHTPYTVSEKLLRRCAELAREEDVPLCIHVAETSGELEFLRAGTGEMLEFRKEFGLWPEWKPPRVSPIRYLHHLGFFERPATLIHCNYVAEEDFDIIAMTGSSVVFCPRSHDYFGHRNHPFLNMLGHGINVALGTDSLISAPSLGILDEIKFLIEDYVGIDPAVLLQMATVNGAKALGLPEDVGNLDPGSPADLVAIALPKDGIEGFDGPLEAAFSKHTSVVFSMAGGEILLHS